MKKASKKEGVFILGAGVTGLSAGFASGLLIYEAEKVVGGICTSYYMRKGSRQRIYKVPKDGNVYHFEIGGGHWIFGGSPEIKQFIEKLTPFNKYGRVSSVYLPDKKKFIPYPLQNHLSYLDKNLSEQSLNEILNPPRKNVRTMEDWLEISFGKTLSNLFFNPFHKLYTAGLYTRIAPQDSYKSPISKEDVMRGFEGRSESVGYNTTFIYPKNGLDSLMRGLAKKCKINFGKRVKKIDLKNKVIIFGDGSEVKFKNIISTLPLNKMIKMTGIKVLKKPSPSPAVLVINVGAEKGELCPNDHWVYIPKSKSGFHRVGFYSNVDPMFLPKKNRQDRDKVSIYVEKAYPEDTKLTLREKEKVSKEIIKELQEWKWIGKVEVYDPTWIETAYTWSWPNSGWREKSLQLLEEEGIHQVGRYGRWIFQGIADSIRDGLEIGKKFK